jgi:pyrimidine operon attenuation protein/uracil phosphoribosyltransferase
MKISLVEMGKTKKRNVREAIISILSREYPLNVKKIFSRVKKEYALDVTYQAVFNMMKEMIDDGILEKSERDYKLNIGWIKQLQDELIVIMNSYGLSATEKMQETQQGVNKFISEVAPKIRTYIGKEKSCIVGISTGVGSVYAMALWKYLAREGLEPKYITYDPLDEASKPGINVSKEDVEGRIVVVVDAYIYSGRTFTATMKKFNKFKKKLNFKEIKFAVDEDKSGMADFARVKG